MTDDEWIDDLDDAPPNPANRAGVLCVPAVAADNAAIVAEHAAFLADKGIATVLILTSVDEAGVETITNTEAFRARGYKGGDNVEDLEAWLGSTEQKKR